MIISSINIDNQIVSSNVNFDLQITYKSCVDHQMNKGENANTQIKSPSCLMHDIMV